MIQSRQSITDKSSGVVEASNPGTGQLRRKVAFVSPDTDESSNDEKPPEGGLPSQHSILANGQSSTQSSPSPEQSSYKILRSEGPATSPQDTLGQSIRDETFEPADENLRPFLPRDKLEGLLTEQRIIQALETEGGFPPERLKAIAQDIINPRRFDSETQPYLRSRKEILVILSLIDKVSTIESFIDDDLFDYDLPFRYARGPDSPSGHRHRLVMKTCDLSRQSREIPLFNQWSQLAAETFEAQQWKIHIPLFTGIPEKTERPTHYTLAHKTIAPYVSKVEVGSGGFSAVHKVEIHAAHVMGSDIRVSRVI